jgi:hypothetical protein
MEILIAKGLQEHGKGQPAAVMLGVREAQAREPSREDLNAAKA